MESKCAVETSSSGCGLGRCRHFFWLGVVFDVVGMGVLFTGVFSNFLFYDLLLYLGAIIIFLSLLWWIFWYTGNLELPPEENLLLSPRFRRLSIVQAFRQSWNRRISITLSNMSSTFTRIRRLPRRRHIQRAAAGPAGKGAEDDSVGEGDKDDEREGAGPALATRGLPVTTPTPQDQLPRTLATPI